jgi:serine protease Do
MKTKRIVSTLALGFAGGLLAVFTFFLISGKTHPTAFTQQNMPARYVGFGGDVPSGGCDFTYAAESSVHAVVHVKTQSTRDVPSENPFYDFFFGDRANSYNQQPVLGFGSGVIISPEGYIVTNNHVIDKSNKIEVVLNDKRSFTAKVVGTDPSTDIALLKIDEKNLPFIPYGNSDNLKIGEWVLAVGNPFNLTSTVTAGIVSAKARNIDLLKDQFAIESFIQTDAAVNPGNSGGALVNTKGELVGINTAIATPTGSYAGNSFAIPVDIVKKVVQDLIEYGEAQRAVLGVTIEDITSELAKEKGLDDVNGVYVNGLKEDGAAAEAGLKVGDVIVKINDIAINNPSELQEQVGKFRPNDKIMITVNRENKMKQFEVTLRNLKGDTKIVKKGEIIETLGAKFEDITASDRKNLKISYGVKVVQLQSGKLRKVGVEEGFIILKINEKPVNSVEDIKQALNKVEGGGVYIQGIYPNKMMAYYAFGL